MTTDDYGLRSRSTTTGHGRGPVTVCKICDESVFNHQPTTWANGRRPGVIHTSCAPDTEPTPS